MVTRKKKKKNIKENENHLNIGGGGFMRIGDLGQLKVPPREIGGGHIKVKLREGENRIYIWWRANNWLMNEGELKYYYYYSGSISQQAALQALYHRGRNWALEVIQDPYGYQVRKQGHVVKLWRIRERARRGVRGAKGG